MTPAEYLSRLIMSLSEVETVELGRLFVSAGRPPSPLLRGEFDPQEVEDWIESNLKYVVPSLLRVIDPGDEIIAYLYRLGVFDYEIKPEDWDQEVLLSPRYRANRLIVRFEVHADSGDSDDEGDITYKEVGSQYVSLSGLAISSAALFEIFFHLAIANHPLALEWEFRDPFITVQSGSIQYAFNGSLLAAGIALIVACGAGVTAPAPTGLVYGLGGLLASTGLIQLAFEWRKQAAESRKLHAEALKLKAEALKNWAEAQQIIASTRQGARFVETPQDTPYYQYSRPAYSALVSPEEVRREAKRLGLTEEYATHLLNRALRPYLSLRSHFQRINTETTTYKSDKDKEEN